MPLIKTVIAYNAVIWMEDDELEDDIGVYDIIKKKMMSATDYYDTEFDPNSTFSKYSVIETLDDIPVGWDRHCLPYGYTRYSDKQCIDELMEI